MLKTLLAASQTQPLQQLNHGAQVPVGPDLPLAESISRTRMTFQPGIDVLVEKQMKQPKANSISDCSYPASPAKFQKHKPSKGG